MFSPNVDADSSFKAIGEWLQTNKNTRVETLN